MSTPTCNTCGATVVGGDPFCPNCGTQRTNVRSVAEESGARSLSYQEEQEATLIKTLEAATHGQYRILNELGRGGMAIVYLAEEMALDRHVAIKVMSPTLGGDADEFETFLKKFQEEAKTAAKLSHLHIIPIYAVGEYRGLCYFVMKFVSGESIDSVIKRKRLMAIGTVQEILAQAAGALDHAHRKGVIHRDIKPSNLMIDEDGLTLVTDFGIAKRVEDQLSRSRDTVIGTLPYMSPEQRMGKRVDGATDQYALGVAVYEMLTGRLPIEARSEWDFVTEPPTPVETYRPDCPPFLRRVIHRMLEKNPRDRFPDLQEVVSLVRRETPAAGADVRTELLTIAAEGIERQANEKRAPLPRKTVSSEVTADSGSRIPGAKPGAPKRKRSRAVPVVVGAVMIAGAGFGLLEWQRGRVGNGTGPVGAADSTEVLATLPPDTVDDEPNEQTPPPSQPAANPAPGRTTPSDTAARRPESPPVTTGRVIVTGLPQDGAILIDNLRQPGADFEIDAGRYVMHLAADGYIPDTLTLNVIGGQIQTISFSGRPVPGDQPEPQPLGPPVIPDSGVVLVVVNPSADLWLNQVLIGRNRSFSLVVPAGSSQCIQALRDEYETVDTTVSVAAHDTLTLVLQMRLGNQTDRPACQRE